MSEVITTQCHSASASISAPADLKSEWLEVIGDVSMSPEINPGDQVLVTYGMAPKHGDIVMVRHDGGYPVMRRYIQATRDIFLTKAECSDFKTMRSDVCSIEVLAVVRSRTRLVC